LLKNKENSLPKTKEKTSLKKDKKVKNLNLRRKMKVHYQDLLLMIVMIYIEISKLEPN
jgi:hypothetical protein